MKVKKSLYVCYFGVREPLVQTQVLPYLREIRKDGIEVSILTFEPGNIVKELGQAGVEELREKLAAEGVAWHWLSYHKRFSVLATAWDIFRGTMFIRRFIARERPDVLHGRVHVPTLMAALARKLSRHKPKLLFDIRGFMPEEYTDAGIWPEGGILYRTAKRVERWLMKEADGFVVLTEKAREILFPESKESGRDKLGRPVEVIPCCVDMSRFASATPETRVKMRNELGIDGRFVMAYVGAFGGWYLTQETADLFGVLRDREPGAFAMILTQSKPEMIEPLLRERGFQDGDYLIRRVRAAEIPEYLSAADAAVSFIKPCYSKLASSPTKNAEYLACGLPIIANAGVGDVEPQLVSSGVGVIVSSFNEASYGSSLEQLFELGNISSRCREVAKSEFELEKVGGERYRTVYSNLYK